MNLKIPPAIVFLLSVGMMFGIYFLTDAYSYFVPYRTFFSRIFLVGGVLAGVMGIVAFRVKGTTVDPTKPAKASSLVTDGIYRFTRNPMYVGMGLVLIGGIIRLGNPFCVISLLIYVWYITQFQIKPEEQALRQLFGDEYDDYCKKVRRWL